MQQARISDKSEDVVLAMDANFPNMKFLENEWDVIGKFSSSIKSYSAIEHKFSR